MTNFEKCIVIKDSLLARTAEAIVYKDYWSIDFSISNILSCKEALIEQGICDVDPTDLTVAQMEVLGFRRGSDKHKMLLIPLWLFPFLASEFMCASILTPDEVSVRHLDDADNDHRFGSLAQGVLPKDCK